MSQTQLARSNNSVYDSLKWWRIVQSIVWVIGVFIFLCLIFCPDCGLLIFWNILIPVAPLLLVVSTGTWRNICPLATTNLLPRRFNLSRRKKMSKQLQAKLGLAAVVILFVIAPLRHTLFDYNGLATAILLFGAASTGLIFGFIYDWKSGWCSSLCPIHPVEKLYGGKTFVSLPNAHCQSCANCSLPCADSTPGMHPLIVQKNIYQQLSGSLLAGGFPGFIWGWFHVPDGVAIGSVSDLAAIYQLPFTGLVVSLLAYLVVLVIIKKTNERMLVNLFAALAVSCYYWYRIPNLFGFGIFHNDGLLVNLEALIPAWVIYTITVSFVAFFFYWFMVRRSNKKSWTIRPAFEAR